MHQRFVTQHFIIRPIYCPPIVYCACLWLECVSVVIILAIYASRCASSIYLTSSSRIMTSDDDLFQQPIEMPAVHNGLTHKTFGRGLRTY